MNKSIFGLKNNWYKKFNNSEKLIFWIMVGSLVLSLAMMGLILTIRTYDSDLSIQQCNQLRIDDVRYALQLQEDNYILAFIYAFSSLFKLLIGAIAVGWVLHGVGFKVVGQ